MPFDSESIFSDEDIGITSLFGDISPSSGALTPPSSAPQSVAARDSFLDDEKRVVEEKQQEEIPDISLPSVFPPLPKYEDLKEVLPLVGAVLKLESAFISSRQDIATPDRWIKRSPELIRHTGKHPLNCEVPLKTLFDAGFLTPAHLFYVRSHGAVPQVDEQGAADWTLKIHGLVENELELSLEDLKKRFPVVSLPMTLACASGRRKEQNMVSQTLGFNWGPGALATGLFTGVYLTDVLDAVKPIRGKAKHVIFEGTDKLPNGPYGTSQKLSWAADRSKGMLIAWGMNGRPLPPDHGYPLRVMVPGHVGGRSVKWLHRIEISDIESQHHLHFYDNRILPTQVSVAEARSTPKWWYDPKYVLYDLNTNSVIAHPDHDETISLTGSNTFNSWVNDEQRTYKLTGYAYAGGGRRVNRMEISFDGGKEWKLTDITYPEDRFREEVFDHEVFGRIDMTDIDTCFCWCWWSYDASFDEIENSKVIMVRGMDEGLVQQHREIYWNANGMMTSWWFRVAVHRFEEDGETKIRFEHPVLPAGIPGGWMERFKAAGKGVKNPSFDDEASPDTAAIEAPPPPPEVSMTKDDVTRLITWKEIRAQDPAKPWFVVRGNVYDGTDFLKDHPGGPDSILLVASEDATEDFIAIHSMDARAKLAEFHIGILDASSSAPDSSALEASAGVEESDSNTFLQKKLWKSVKLVSRTPISPDTIIFRFAMPDLLQRLGLPVGQHVFVRASPKDDSGEGTLVQRAYTPVSDSWQTGFIDMLIKLYRPCEAYPQGGKMSVLFDNLEIGHEVQLKGPLGSFIWLGKGEASWKGQRYKPGALAMICGGSGVTPILQVLRAVLHDEEDTTTKVYLLTSNKTEDDILCREELDSYMAVQPAGRYRIHHQLTRAPAPVPAPVLPTISEDDREGEEERGNEDERERKSEGGGRDETDETDAEEGEGEGAAEEGSGGEAASDGRGDSHGENRLQAQNENERRWTGGFGRITNQTIVDHFPPPNEEALVLACGPDGLIETVKRCMEAVGWDLEKSLVVF